MPDNKYPILVIDATQRSALAVVRSLAKHPQLEIYTAAENSPALAGESKFSKRHVVYPHPGNYPLQFISWLSKFIADNHIAAIYPTTEITSQLILMHQELLPDCNIPFADFDQVMAIADKSSLIELAKTLGIPAPNSLLYENALAFSYGESQEFPIVLKPSLSHIWLSNRWLSTQVQIAYNQDQLQECLKQPYLQNHPFMVQEFIPGSGAGIFALYDHGKEVAMFAHKRLREKPPSGGVSVLCESATCDERLLAYARSLLKSKNWHGVAMVEFRVDSQGNAYLMEVNTRFWGSLQLAIDAGVDFPYLLHQITFGEKAQQVEQYKVGRRLRWLLGDIDSLYLAMRSNTFSLKQKLTYLLKFLTPHPLRTKHEINRLSDFRPAIFEFKKYIAELFKK